ncbi:MAG: hypothetical protein ABR600_09880 [Actinomycetota bacterium]
MRKLLGVLGVAVALCSCSPGEGSTTHDTGDRAGAVRLIPSGSLRANAYALSYEACSGRSVEALAERLGIGSTATSDVAAAFARRDFVPAARGAGELGCLDGLEGNEPSLPN